MLGGQTFEFHFNLVLHSRVYNTYTYTFLNLPCLLDSFSDFDKLPNNPPGSCLAQMFLNSAQKLAGRKYWDFWVHFNKIRPKKPSSFFPAAPSSSSSSFIALTSLELNITEYDLLN